MAFGLKSIRKAVSKPFKSAAKEVGRGVDSVTREISRGVDSISREASRFGGSLEKEVGRWGDDIMGLIIPMPKFPDIPEPPEPPDYAPQYGRERLEMRFAPGSRYRSSDKQQPGRTGIRSLQIPLNVGRNKTGGIGGMN